MAHTFDTKLRTTGSSSPQVQSYTAGTGATLLVLGIVTAGSTARAGGVPSFNGDPLTQVDQTRIATETNVELWYLINPPTGVAYDLVVPNTGTKTVYLQTSTYIAGSGKTSAFDVGTGNTGVSANPSLNVTTTVNGDVLVDTLGDGLTSVPTANSDTLLSSTDNGLYTDSCQYKLQASLGSATLSYTVGSDDWAMVLGSWKEVTPATSVISTLKQFDTDHSTEIAVGGNTGGDGVSTNIYLDARIASQYFADKIKLNIERRAVGTSFSDTSTDTEPIDLWVNPKPPHVRRSHTTVYDSTRKRLLMFGGYDGTNNYNDVYELTLDSLSSPQPQWRQLKPTGTPPTARRTHVAFFDATLNRMITGFGWTSADNNDLYSLSFSSTRDGAWTTLSPTGTVPAARSQSSICNDTANTKAYLVCGWGATRFSDIQELNYSTTNCAWTQKKADNAVGNPSRRNDTACVFDAANGRIVLFGGYDGTNRKNDTWTFTIATTTYLEITSTVGTAPSTRELMFCALDTTNNHMVIFGGRNGTAATDIRKDMAFLTLGLATEAWTVVTPTAGAIPAFTWTNAGCYDPDHKVMLCVGGEDNSLQRTRHVLGLDCSSSSTLSVVQAVLNQRMQGRDALAYGFNPDRNEMLMAGGFARVDPTDSTFVNGDHTNDLWIYDFANNELYNPIRDAFHGFTNREGATVVYDTNRDRFLIFGGLTGNNTTNNTWYNDTWELKANADGKYIMTKLAPTGTKPGNRWLHAACYDINNNRMIVFGGDEAETYKNDLWELDFSGSSDGAWAQLSPTGTAPSARRQPTYIYNSSAGCMVISHGATTSTNFVSDTFKLDLSTNDGAWSSPTIGGTAPTARRGMSGAWQSSNKYMVCFGGFTGGSSHSQETFYLDMTDETAPITWTWNTLAPSTKPEARRSHATALSPTTNKMAIMCGRDDQAYTFNTRYDVWLLDVSNATPSNWNWANQDPNVYLNGSAPVTGLSSSTNYHWQGWITASLAGTSTKTAFGGNAESATDFSTSSTSNLTPSVFDTVTVSEGIQISLSLPSPIVDTVTVSEGIQISLSLPSPIVDSVTVSEFVRLDPSLPLLFEAVTVSEDVRIDPSIPLLSDSITVTDVPTVFIVSLVPSVFDSVTVSEDIRIDPSIPLLSEAVTVSEFVRLDPSLPIIADNVTVSEDVRLDPSIPLLSDSITVSEFVRIDPSLPVISESVTVTDVPTVLIVSLVPSVFDSVTVSEDTRLDPSLPVISESVTVTDVPILVQGLVPSIFDEVTVSEFVRLDPSLPLLSDSVTVSENVRVDPSIPVISDTVTVSESVRLDPSLPVISDSVTVSEAVMLEPSLPIISETITVSEFIRLDPSLPIISESVTTTDVPTVVVVSLVPFVFDSVSVSEDVRLDPSIPLSSDTVTVSENVRLDPSLPVISDSVTVSEFVRLDPSLPVIIDTVTISESVKLDPSIPLLFESVVVSESVQIEPSLPLMVESVTVSDVPAIIISGGEGFAVSVFDTVTVSEDVRLDPSLPLMVESVTVTEFVKLDPSLPLLSESVTVTDTPTVLIPSLVPFIFDSVTVSEDTGTLNIPLPVSVFDLVTLDDTEAGPMFENVTVSEFIRIDPSIPLLAETIAVTDVPTILVVELFPSVFDSVTVSESVRLDPSIPLTFEAVTVSEFVKLDPSIPLISEVVTVSESVRIDPSIPLISESITVTDVPTIVIVSLVPFVFDLVTVTEGTKIEPSLPLIGESITVTDVPTIVIVSLVPFVFDSVTVIDSPRVDPSIPLISDSVTVSESVKLDPSLPLLSDSVTVSEFVKLDPSIPVIAETVTVTDVPTLMVFMLPSVFDSVTATDVPSIFIPTLVPFVFDTVSVDELFNTTGQVLLSLFEQVTATDVPSVVIPTLFVNVFDSISVSEDTGTLSIPLPVSSTDTITVTDVPSIYIPTLFVSIFDSVAVSENIRVDPSIPLLSENITVIDVPTLVVLENEIVFDTVTVTDVPSVLILVTIFVFDSVTVSDVPLVLIPSDFINSFDSITVSDVFSGVVVDSQGSMAVFDQITVTENIKLEPSLPVISDSVFVTDTPQLVIQTLFISVFDQATVTDSPTVIIPTLFTSVNDSVSVSEDVRLDPSIPLLSESITVTDVPIVFLTTLFLSVLDTISVSESTSVFIPTLVPSLFEVIAVTEGVSVLIPTYFPSVFDIISISEGQNITTVCEVKVNEVISLSEAITTDNMIWGADNPSRRPFGYVKVIV